MVRSDPNPIFKFLFFSFFYIYIYIYTLTCVLTFCYLNHTSIAGMDGREVVSWVMNRRRKVWKFQILRNKHRNVKPSTADIFIDGSLDIKYGKEQEDQTPDQTIPYIIIIIGFKQPYAHSTLSSI